MGHGASTHAKSSCHKDVRSSSEEITERLEILKKLDSKVQNMILLELDKKMQDLVSSHCDSGESEPSSRSELPRPKDFDPAKRETRYIVSLNVTVLKVINIPGISDSTDLVTVKAHLDEGEGEASVEGVKTTDVKNGATFENSIVFQAKGLGVENLSTYKSVTVRVFAGDKQLATVTIPLDATSSSVETYQVDPSGTLFMEVKKGLENFGKTSQRQSMRVLKIEREDSEKTGAEAAVVPQPSEGGDEGAAEGAPA